MPQARKSMISLAETPYYHCVSRCVRRAFLCGKDKFTGQSYEHRRQWVKDRLLLQANIFAIDVCAFAVMSNHTHVVLHVNTAAADEWSMIQVIERWHKLFHGTSLTRDFLDQNKRHRMSAALKATVADTAEVWRNRLKDISWFMRALNEFIARQANKEDQCTGRFWEGRFKSQALLNHTALITCMAYVDLNPIRANIASTPETSDYTSIQQRIITRKLKREDSRLMPFDDELRKEGQPALPISLVDYAALVSITSQQAARNNSSSNIQRMNSLLIELDITSGQWLELTSAFESSFHHAAGSVADLERFKRNRNMVRIKDRNKANLLMA